MTQMNDVSTVCFDQRVKGTDFPFLVQRNNCFRVLSRLHFSCSQQRRAAVMLNGAF